MMPCPTSKPATHWSHAPQTFARTLLDFPLRTPEPWTLPDSCCTPCPVAGSTTPKLASAKMTHRKHRQRKNHQTQHNHQACYQVTLPETQAQPSTTKYQQTCSQRRVPQLQSPKPYFEVALAFAFGATGICRVKAPTGAPEVAFGSGAEGAADEVAF